MSLAVKCVCVYSKALKLLIKATTLTQIELKWAEVLDESKYKKNMEMKDGCLKMATLAKSYRDKLKWKCKDQNGQWIYV